MGLFDAFRKKEAPSPDKDGGTTLTELYNGMKAEVLTEANALIFVANLDRLSGTAAEVHAESEGVLPQTVYNHPVKLRCFRRDGTTLTLTGKVTQNNSQFWRVEGLKYVHNSESRSFFRQSTGVDGLLAPEKGPSALKSPCKILDISAGGARVRTERLFAKGAVFRLETTLLPEDSPFFMTCRVVRVNAASPPTRATPKYEYGCQFIGLPKREEERLLQAIFILQRRILQARRDQ